MMDSSAPGRRIDSCKKEYAALLSVTVLTFMGFYCPQPLLDTIAAGENISKPEAGLLMTVTILPFAAAPFLYGRLLHFLTLSRLLRASLLGAGLSLFLAGLSGNFPVMLLFRSVQGILLPAVLLCLTTRIGSLYCGRELQVKMATYAAVTMVGAYGGRILAGFLCSRFSPGSTLAFFGLLQLCAIVPSLYVSDAEKPGSHEFSPSAVGSFLRDKKLLPVLLIGPVCIFDYSGVLNFLPFHLRSIDSSISEAAVGLAYLTGLFSACVAMNSRRLLNILKGEWNLLLAAASLFFLFFPLFLFPSLLPACTAMLGAGTAFAIIYGNCPGMVNRASSYDHGITNSLYLSVYYLFSALGSLIPVIIYSSWGVGAFITLLLFISAADILLILRARHIASLS